MTNKREQQRARRDACMPEVKRLVKKYGLATVGGCVARLREHAKAQKKLAELRREAADLEKRL
jgi:hypothetical protein